MIKEIVPGVFHWTALHERIHIEVSSYYFEEDGILFDSMVPSEGLEWFDDREPPSHILLSNRHHYRHSTKFQEAFGCTVWCHREGLHEFPKGELVNAFEFGHEFRAALWRWKWLLSVQKKRSITSPVQVDCDGLR